LRARLERGEAVLGIWSIIPSAPLAEVIGGAGMHFQILDMEHGFYTAETLEASIRACEAVGCSPLVRPPSLNQDVIQVALDLGAHGVIVPQVRDAGAAEEVVRAVRFPPRGRRGFNPFTRAGGYGASTPAARARLEDGWALTAVIVENPTAFAEMDRIVALPGLDMVYLGVYDMSVALGCPGATNDPRVVDFVERATATARSAGKAVGVMARDQAEMERFLAMGANVVVYVVDTFVIGRTMAAAVELFAHAARTHLPRGS
jgi:4-hydroxy-2-oxoheptanedioate aldolase